MFSVKDNYFGAFTQFTTMQEYLERFDHDPNSMGDPVEEKYRPGRVSLEAGCHELSELTDVSLMRLGSRSR